MSETWLILDCPFLAHRAESAMGGLSYEGNDTAVVFGLMRDVVGWSDLFSTGRFVFCFDAGRNRRLEIYPDYKANRRKELSDEEEAERIRFRMQVKRLREEDLFQIGYRNVFWEDGFESDDVIASVVLRSIPKDDEVVIVSSDSDFWQLISPTVSCFNPSTGKKLTHRTFAREKGISPTLWADVKSIAGCNTDNVKGVDGIGIKSAVQFLTGQMKSDSRRHKSIVDGNRIWRRNLRLIQLPFEGCPKFELREDRVTKRRWKNFCERYGMRSVRGLCPTGR